MHTLTYFWPLAFIKVQASQQETATNEWKAMSLYTSVCYTSGNNASHAQQCQRECPLCKRQ